MDAAEADHPAAAVADYGGAYLKIVEGSMAKLNDRTDRLKEEAAEKQMARFRELEAMLSARLAPDEALRQPEQDPADAQAGAAADGDEVGSGGGGRRGGVAFDGGLDDDEVLLRFFKEVDTDCSGTISREELMRSGLLTRKENAQMAQVLLRAFGCDLEALGEALAHLDARDFGAYAQRGPGGGVDEGASVKAVFEAMGPAVSVFHAAHPGAAPGAVGSLREVRDARVASRADVERLAEAVRSWPEAARKPPRLALALEALAKTLPPEGQLDFLAFKAAMRKVPRVAGQRMEWVQQMHLDATLARHLPPGALDDG